MYDRGRYCGFCIDLIQKNYKVYHVLKWSNASLLIENSKYFVLNVTILQTNMYHYTRNNNLRPAYLAVDSRLNK